MPSQCLYATLLEFRCAQVGFFFLKIYLFTCCYFILTHVTCFFSESLISIQKLFDVHSYFAYSDVCVPCKFTANEGQRQASDALELELDKVVS